MSFDERMAGLAARAAEAHASSDGFATDTLKARVRRGRRVRTAVATAGAVTALAVVGVVGVAVADGWRTTPPAGPTSPEPVPTETATATPTPTPAEPVRVLEGWSDAGVDPAVFGGLAITDTVEHGDRAVVVGCDNGPGAGGSVFPAWVAEEPDSWVPATGPRNTIGVSCLRTVVSTPHGLFAAFPELYRSDDGYTWARVDLGLPDGAQTSPGVTAVWSVGDRVTALVLRASLAESTVATLYTSTDGETWEAVDDSRARVFDNGGIAAVVARPGGGLLAVGASPGGEFVPTAAMWTSDDGLAWTLTSPRGAGFEDCAATDVTAVQGGYTAAGTCWDGERSRLAVWSSADGATWSPPVLPPDSTGDTPGSVGDVTVARVGDITFALGARYYAATEESVRALWRTEPDGSWVEVEADSVVPVPFHLVGLGGRTVGFWSLPYASDDDPVRVLVADDRAGGS